MKATLTFIFCLLVISPTNDLSASPMGDSFQANGVALVDDYGNAALTFDGIAQIPPTAQNLTSIGEQFREFPGIPGGVNAIRADGTQDNVGVWQQSGHIVEFTISSSNGGFISNAPQGHWGISFRNIDLDRSGPIGTPQILGMYIAFRNSGNELPYNIDPFLSGLPFGVGPHPIDAGRQVVYVTDEGASFDGWQFAALNGKKFNVNLSSFTQFFFLSLEQIVLSLGVSGDINQPPFVNQLVLGFLVKGTEPLFIQGDYDRDGDVTNADYAKWKSQFSMQLPAFSGSDGNGDGIVDAADYVIWRDHLGFVSPDPPPDGAGSASVFEGVNRAPPPSLDQFQKSEIVPPIERNFGKKKRLKRHSLRKRNPK